jgi:hypothetical protein
MRARRVGWVAAAVGVVAVGAAAAPSFGGARGPVGFAKPVFVDQQLAGGEPIVFYDAKHQDYIYSSHEGTTHTLHDGLVDAPVSTAEWGANYRNQVNIWTSRDAKHWSVVNLNGTGFEADPSTNQGFSDPDLTQDDGGRVYNTGIDLVNDALFSSADGGRTWDRGTVQCHEGDRPWLAGAHKDEVFLATDPTYSENGHTIFRSTDGGATCSTFGIGDYGSNFTGYGKLYYNRANGSLVEPVIYGTSNANAVGVAILPHASHAFDVQKGAFHQIKVSPTKGLLTHFPSIAIDRAGNIDFAWADAPSSGKNSIWFAALSPGGKVIVKPRVIAHPGTTVLWPWVASGSRGNVSVVWYQYDKVVPNPDDQNTVGNVYVYEATMLGLGTSHARHWVTNASGRPVHSGGICQGGTTCVATGQDRRLGDYLTNNLDGRGCVMIATGDTTIADPATGQARAWALPLFIQQNRGPSLTGRSCGPAHSAAVAPMLRGVGPDRGVPAVLGALLLMTAVGVAARRPVMPGRPVAVA